MTPLVSILIPAYNAEPWIADTIDSALRQTWPRKEIIVVDDGSSDRTLEIARRFTGRDVVVASQPNQGAAAARNHAYSLCHGEYVQWLDADDLLDPDKITRQIEVLGSDPDNRVLASGAWGHFMYRTSRATFIPSPLWCDLDPAEWLLRKLGQDCHMQTATWLVSRELTEAAGPWNTRLLGDDDGEYFCRVKLQSKRIRFVPGSRVYYRMTANHRLSHVGRSEAKLRAHFLSMRLHINYILSLRNDHAARAACLAYLQKYYCYYYPDQGDYVSQLRQLAASLGGSLVPPIARPKYRCVQHLLGWKAARRIQDTLPSIRWSVLRGWDRTAFAIEKWRGLSHRLTMEVAL